MRDHKTKAQIKANTKNKLRDNIHPLSPHPNPDMKQTPHLSHPPIIHNNNILDTEFQVQMRQSDKCGSVRNNEIFNLHLGSGAGLESASPASCKTPATFIDSIRPNN